MASALLDDIDVKKLTGRATKSKQIEQLREMKLPFFINALGQPVVARSVVEGVKPEAAEQVTEWVPGVLRSR